MDKKASYEYLNKIIQTQTRLASAAFDLDFFMNLVVEEVEKLTLATGTVIELVDGNDMVYRAATGTVKSHLGLRLPRNSSISGLCVQKGEILRCDDTEKDPRVNLEACRRVKARSMIVAPLFYEGGVVGVLKILSSKPGAFTQEDVNTLQLMGNLIGSALAHQISYQQSYKALKEKTDAISKLQKKETELKYLADHDMLTDLPNRHLFLEKLADSIVQAKKNSTTLAVFFLDVDHFKKINDTLGHVIGDRILKEFANRVLQSIGQSDIPARLGGDEFVILFDREVSKEKMIFLANKIIDIISKPFYCEGEEIRISTSIGIALLTDDIHDAEMLIKKADGALYRAKKAGRNRFVVC